MDRYLECSKCKRRFGGEYPGLHCCHCGGKVKAPKSDGQHRIQTRKVVKRAA